MSFKAVDLIRRLRRELPDDWQLAQPLTDAEIDQLVSQLNALRQGGVNLENTVNANHALFTAHEADTALHSKWGIDWQVQCRMGAAPNTQFDIFVAGAKSTSDGEHVLTADIVAALPGSKLTIDITVFAAAGGLDYVAPLLAGWHCAYIIYDDTNDTWSAIGSPTGPSAGGPTLPGTYNHWALVGYFFVNDRNQIDPFDHCPTSGLFRLHTNAIAPNAVFRYSIVSGAGAWGNVNLGAAINIPPDCRAILVNALVSGAAGDAIYARPIGSTSPVGTYTAIVDHNNAACDLEFERYLFLDGTQSVQLQRATANNSYIYLVGAFLQE